MTLVHEEIVCGELLKVYAYDDMVVVLDIDGEVIYHAPTTEETLKWIESHH